MILNCKTCETAFKIPTCRKGLIVTCSKECSNAYKSRVLMGVNKRRVYSTCVVCEAKTETTPYRARMRGGGKTCSRRCSLVLFSLLGRSQKGKSHPERSGKNHHNWKGGITTQDKLDRVRFQRQYAPMILERDKFTCRECGVFGVAFHVDHIKSWARHPQLRFDLSNCQTLCLDCHYLKTFGRVRSDTGKQWATRPIYRKEVV